jgi:hypothetical protein
MKIINLEGLRFNNLTVLKKTEKRKNKSVVYLCRCEACGREDYYVSQRHLVRKKHPVKSCGCEQVKKGSKNPLWKGCGDISGDFWNRAILRNLRSRGERRRLLGVSITIEYAWELFLKQKKRCALSGMPLIISNDNTINNASIDRIDSSIGYHVGNVQWVHKDINNMKQSYSQEYFIELCKKVTQYENNK